LPFQPYFKFLLLIFAGAKINDLNYPLNFW
jgi:hypothetical protein